MTACRLAFLSVLVVGLGLAGCAAPSLDRGFVIRTDLRTTDCAGEPHGDINTQTASGFDFLTLRATGEPVNVSHCVSGAVVRRTAGLSLRPGDVLFVSTGVVGPKFASNGKPYDVMFPSAVSAPVGLAIRKVHPILGRLYQHEDQFLAGAFAMAAREKDQVLSDTAPLVAALDRQQPLLWNTLIDNLRLWRPVDNDRTKSGRPGLVLLVDYGLWCAALRAELGTAQAPTKDVDALTAYFSGTPGRCPGDGAETERATMTREYSLVTNPARSALQAVALGPTAAGGFPSANSDVGLHTNLTVQLKGTRLAMAETYSASAHWTLADWENAGICVDDWGAPLSIKAVQMRDGKWIYLQSSVDESPTLLVQLVFTQSLQARRFVDTVPWHERWKRVLAHSDLDKLYPSDIRSIAWSASPADQAICLL